MSQEEIRQQHETIKTMAEQISALKKLASWSPLYAVLGMLLSGAFSLGVFFVKYDSNLVKRPEFSQYAKDQSLKNNTFYSYHIIDSVFHENQNVRLEKLENSRKMN